MNIPGDILEKARRVAQEAEVYYVHHRDTPVVFEANQLKLLETREVSGAALRLIKDGRLGFSSTTNLADVRGLVNNALEVAPLGVRAWLEFPAPQRYPSVDVYDPEVESLGVETMVHLGQTLIDAVRQRWPELLCEVGVSKSTQTVHILNSRGAEAKYQRSVFSVSMEGTLIRDTDMLFVWEGHSSCKPIVDAKLVQESILEQLELARRLAPAATGEVPVIFTPHGVAGALLYPLLSGFNGEMVLQGASPLVGKLGERVLNPSISLWDDPTLSYVPGSRICDDEGVPSRPVPLVREGVIENFLYDLQTAAQARKKSTASASRSLASLPSPSSSVLIITEGSTPFRDMVAGMKEGLIVRSLLGAGQGNMLGGDFSANVLLGFKVENGEIVGRVKNTMIDGNVYRLLNGPCTIGGEARWVGGSVKLPDIRFERVSVSTKD